MVGLNGALVSLLCGAYFALIVCALWDEDPADERDGDSRSQLVAANSLANRHERARVERVDQTISGIVLSLRRRERPTRRRRRPARCAPPIARAVRAPSRR